MYLYWSSLRVRWENSNALDCLSTPLEIRTHQHLSKKFPSTFGSFARGPLNIYTNHHTAIQETRTCETHSISTAVAAVDSVISVLICLTVEFSLVVCAVLVIEKGSHVFMLCVEIHVYSYSTVNRGIQSLPNLFLQWWLEQ